MLSRIPSRPDATFADFMDRVNASENVQQNSSLVPVHQAPVRYVAPSPSLSMQVRTLALHGIKEVGRAELITEATTITVDGNRYRITPRQAVEEFDLPSIVRHRVEQANRLGFPLRYLWVDEVGRAPEPPRISVAPSQRVTSTRWSDPMVFGQLAISETRGVIFSFGSWLHTTSNDPETAEWSQIIRRSRES